MAGFDIFVLTIATAGWVTSMVGFYMLARDVRRDLRELRATSRKA